ncbi:MAG TPA: hypothetical protein ENK86_01900 [Campylobacterales bacterium]|nr:hypothetical protein [Campylobacterales bacterium]
MKKFTQGFALNLLLILGLGGVCQAETLANLPKSDKVEKVANEASTSSEEDGLPMKLEMGATAGQSMEKGKGCADVTGLEEAEGKIMVAMPDIPEAETIPCDEVDCKDLPEASLGAYKVHHIPTAKTEVACEE